MAKLTGTDLVTRKHNIPFDFYPTPEWAVSALLKKEKFRGHILEPACGAGHIAYTLLKETGCTVTPADIQDEDYIYGLNKGVDFLKFEYPRYNNVITNPPYKLATPFLRKALDLATDKVTFFLKFRYLESDERYKLFVEERQNPKTVYIFSSRVQLWPYSKSKPNNGGTEMYCWMVWDKNWKGDTKIRWIEDYPEKPNYRQPLGYAHLTNDY